MWQSSFTGKVCVKQVNPYLLAQGWSVGAYCQVNSNFVSISGSNNVFMLVFLFVCFVVFFCVFLLLLLQCSDMISLNFWREHVFMQATNLSLHFPHKHQQQLLIQPPHQLMVLQQVLHPTQLAPLPLHPTLALLLHHLVLLTLADQSKSCICNQFPLCIYYVYSSIVIHCNFATVPKKTDSWRFVSTRMIHKSLLIFWYWCTWFVQQYTLDILVYLGQTM